MEKKKKSFRKYPVGFLAVFVSAVLMLTMFNALAATTVNVGIADLEVTAGDKVTPSDVSSTGFTATIYGGNNNCGVGPFSNTGSVTFENTSDRNYVLSFKYNITSNWSTTTGNAVNINGEPLSDSDPDSLSGSTEVKIGAKQKLSMNITSPSGQNNYTAVSISELKYVPITTAAYEQVGKDYTSETETNNVASLWNVTVKAGTESIEKIDVKLGDITSQDGEQTLDTPIVTDAEIVLGVVTNLSGEDVNKMGGFTVMVNGEAL